MLASAKEYPMALIPGGKNKVHGGVRGYDRIKNLSTTRMNVRQSIDRVVNLHNKSTCDNDNYGSIFTYT